MEHREELIETCRENEERHSWTASARWAVRWSVWIVNTGGKKGLVSVAL